MEEKVQYSALLDNERLINGNEVGSSKTPEFNNNQKIKENTPKSNFYKNLGLGIAFLVIFLLGLTTGLCIFLLSPNKIGN